MMFLMCHCIYREGDSPSSYAPTDDAAIDAQGPLQALAPSSAGLKGKDCRVLQGSAHLTGAFIGVLKAMPRFLSHHESQSIQFIA